MVPEVNKISHIDFLKLRNISLSKIGKLLNEENVVLVGYSRLENFNLLELYNQAEKGDNPSFILLAQFCVINAKNASFRNHALDALKLLSMNVEGNIDYVALYYYSASLIEVDNVTEGLKILKDLSDQGFAPGQCKWAIVNWYGHYGQAQNLSVVRPLLKSSSDFGHIRGRLFFTRFRMQHGKFHEKLLSPFYVIAGFIYGIRLRNLPVYHKKMLF